MTEHEARQFFRGGQGRSAPEVAEYAEETLRMVVVGCVLLLAALAWAAVEVISK